MRRRLFNVLCLLSLMLAITLVPLWVGSLWRSDGVTAGLPHGKLLLTIRSSGGALWFELFTNNGIPGIYYSGQPFVDRAAIANLFWLPQHRTGSFTLRPGGTYHYRGLIIPHWIPLLICLLLPMAWLRSRRRSARLARTGHCPACGYDLRGTLGPTCPECGAAAAKHPLLSSAA